MLHSAVFCSIASLLLFAPAVARATEIEFKPGVVIEVDGDVEDSFLDNGDLLLQWKSGTGSLILPGYAKAWILEVGGGGAGGSGTCPNTVGTGGGGGAGGFVESKNLMLTAGQYAITVGAGGVSHASADNLPGEDGGDSSIIHQTLGSEIMPIAKGGGGGGYKTQGNSGGSGGGASRMPTKSFETGGTCDAEQGNIGGGNKNTQSSGGGGGAGSPGEASTGSKAAGSGGGGKPSAITGEEVWYAGGGGGSVKVASLPGNGGKGGGGKGADGADTEPEDGEPNTGGGGGGGNNTYIGGEGGSGIVIIRITWANAGDIEKPVEGTSFVYDGSEKECIPAIDDFYTIDGTARAVNVGNYEFTATLKPGMHWGDDPTDLLPVTCHWSITKKKIAPPTKLAASFTYTGEEQIGWSESEEYKFSNTGTEVNRATNAGTYTPTVELRDPNNTEWASPVGSLSWTIQKASIAPPEERNFTYDGENHIAAEPVDGYAFQPGSVTCATNAGDYAFTVKLDDNHQWNAATPPTPNPYTVNWKIARQPVTPPELASSTIVYDGNDHIVVTNSPAWTFNDGCQTNATAVGKYSYKLILDPNYCWVGGGVQEIRYDWEITPQPVDEPAHIDHFCYDATGHSPVETNALYDLTGELCETNVGDYIVTARLKDTANYVWSTGGNTPRSYGWDVTQRVNHIVGLKISGWQVNQTPSAPKCTVDGFCAPGEPTYAWSTNRHAAASEWISWWVARPNLAGEYWLRATIKADPVHGNWSAATAYTSFSLFNHPSECLKDYMDITLSGYTGATVLKNYPVLVRLSETTDGVPNGFSYDRAGENGASLCFTYTWPDQPGRLDDILPFEVDKWDPKGESLIWVRIPELKPAPNSTVIRLYWAQREGMAVPGNDPETVWTNFVAVYHFSATNTYPTVLTDSTANHLDAYPTKRSGATISDGLIGKKVSMNSSTQLLAPNPDYGKTSTDLRIIKYTDTLSRSEAASGSTYSLSNTVAGTSEKRDEVRLIRTSAPGYDDWKVAEVATLTDSNYAVRGHVSREGVQQDYWVDYPSISPASWDEGTADAASYFHSGAFASGAPVAITYKILPYGTLTNELPTAMGEYTAIFDRTAETGWSLVGGPREVAFKILGHAPYPKIDEEDLSASGRILLANRDGTFSGSRVNPEVDGQGWYDSPETSRRYATYPTYWTFPQSLEGGGFNLHKGIEAILWRNSADLKLLWHLQNCRQGNLFPKDDAAALASNQNYLPWSEMSLKISNHNALPITRSEVGWIVMRNVADAAVTSGCFTNGVGTIYFDIVNCRTDSTPSMMKVVVEYLTQDDVDFDLNDDEMCKSIAGDAYTYARYPATWKKASMVPMLTTAGGDFVDQTAATEFAPAITTGGALNNFYRVRVTLNERQPVRFRIRRLARDTKSNRDEDGIDGAPTHYIILDNILVSKPPQSAELVSYGSFDATKTGKEVVGAACALSEAFPSMTDRGLLGRAKLRWFDSPRAEDVVSSAVMHYRWRYLNQAGTKTTDWKTVYLDPENDFWSVEPLQYSQLEGDIEYYFTADLKASFFTYSDYSGSGHAKPVGDFTEELREVENHYRDFATSDQRLPSNGTDWFVRLRSGKSNWESVVVEVTEGDLVGRYPMELVADGQWRALVMLKDEYEGPCKFRFRGVNLQQPRADYTTGVDQVWSPEKTTLPLPGSGKLKETADGATITLDHAAGYLEFKMSDIFNTFTVARAERQDFNYWNDAVTSGDKFHVNYTDTNSVDIAHMKSYALVDDMDDWNLFSATNGLWNETFYTQDYVADFPKDIVYITHDTPNDWNAQNISFVGEKLVKDKIEESASGGLAGKLLGEGKGKLDFTKTGSNTPDGLDTITFRARIGQSATFDGIGYSASGIVDDDYTFFVPLTMSQACAEDGNTLDDMAVGASVSLVCCYFPYEGCYEFRISRPYKGKKRTLSLYKWQNVNGVITSKLLCSREFENIAWTNDRTLADNSKRFYGAFVSCQWSAGATKLICGISNEPQTLGIDDETPAARFSGKPFEGLVYTDKQSPYDSGAYGVMSKDCPARFMMPIKFEDSLALASGFALKEDKDDKTYQYFDATKTQATEQNPLTILGAGDTTAFEDCREDLWEDFNRIAAGKRAINWALPKMRLESVDETEVSPAHWWTGIRTPTNLTQQAIVMVRKKGNTSELGWEEVYRKAVKSYSLDQNVVTIPLRRFGEWDLRFTTGEDAVDVVFDDIVQSRWHAPDDSHIDSSTVIFTYTQGKVERTASKAKAVTLQPARANEDYPVSIRTPILDGLGRVSFQYEKADSQAQVWLQVATNQVARNLYDTYTPSIKSVDFGGPQTVGTWMTLKKYGPKNSGCDEELGTSGRKSVYLGWHDNEDRPVTGVFRLFVPTNVVRTANTEAHKASGARTDYGQLTVTSMSVCDEPGLSERAWRGWNLRTFGDESDSERRMYIADSTLAGFADTTGLSCGLNNQTNLSSLTSKVYREGLDEVAVSGYPAIYSPTFGQVDGKQTGVGAVSFKARLYARQNEISKPGLVVVYGARNNTGDDWTFISSNVVASSVFTNFTWSANGEVYSAIKFELRSPGYTTGVVDTGRIILDEIVISEKIQPSVGFVYARPFRQNLATKTPIDDILSPNEQPLAGESWGIQAKVAVEQLEDEVDLSKGFKVYFSYFTGKKPWGYEQWKNQPGAVLDEELELVGEPSNLVYRSTFNRVKTLVEPAAAGNTVVQYMLTVKYRDKSGEAKEYMQPLTASKWENPSWYWPVDYNRENGGYADTTKFSGYTILDTVSPGRAWINEVSWNDGTKSEAGDSPSTTNQFVEVCVPSGVDMKGWWVQVTGYSQDTATQCRKTGKLFTFGHLNAPSSKATGKAVNGYEFFVMQSPATSRRADGGIKGIDGKNAADGTWSDASQANLTGGSFSYYQPYQLELFRPSGVLEHQFVLQGTNTSTRASSRLQYEGTNLVAVLNREDLTRYGSQSPRRFYAGEETSRKRDGTLYASAGVVGGTKEGDPAPGAEGTWKTGLKFTAGSLNEGQVIPLGWFLPPNGTNSWVYVTVEGEHLYQRIGTNTAASVLLVVPQSSKTNVVYTADNFYELDSITVNGVTNAAPETRHNPCKPSFTYVIDHPTGTVYVVARAGLDKRVLDRLDSKHPDYAPSVVRWLASNWPEKDAADVVPAHFQCVSSDSAPKYPLNLTDMYWLNIPPFTDSGDPEWLLRAGVTDFSVLPQKWMRGAWYTNLMVTVKMYKQHEPSAEKYPVTHLQGLDDARSNQPGTYGAWVSETFKIRGALDLSAKFLPFRTFILNDESFNPEYESVIEIIDPFSKSSPGYSYGWDLHPEKRGSCFWRISIDTDTQPFTTEMLKAEDTY